LRIALVIYGKIETLSGGYLYDRQLVNHLRNSGHQVEVISLPWRDYPRHLFDNFSKDFHQRIIDSNVEILLQDELNHPSLFRLNYNLSRNADFQIVSIVHHLLCSENHPSWINKFYRFVEERYLQSVDGFIFNSKTTQKVVKDMIGWVQPSIVAYPAGDRLHSDINAEQIAERAMRSEPLRILFLGNVIPRKGLHIILEALKGIPHDSWRLSIVGSLEMEKKYVEGIQQSVKAYNFESAFHFSGSLVEEDLKNVMQNSHLMVIPSAYEGFGIAYLEGMGFGLPAIASTAGGAEEIITHGVDGYLIPPGNSAALNRYLSQLIRDRDLLTLMGQAALKRYKCHPTWEDTGYRISSFLESLLNEKGIS
jgi:glycosyltransferase involved in cell wall biosynthesis